MPKNPDAIAQTKFLIETISPKTGEVILDIGCGKGEEINQICATSRPKKVYGLDVSKKALDKAEKLLSKDIKGGKVELIKSSATDKLPFQSNFFDVVFSAELLECLPEKKRIALLKEIYRVLKRGGRVVSEHTDWDTQVWNTKNKNLERKLLHAFADTTQGWMESSDSWMGRKLWGTFQKTKLFKNCRMVAYVLMNTDYKPGFYGYDRSLDLAVAIKNKKSKVTKRDVRGFLSDLKKQAKSGNYFYSVNRYVHVGYK